MVYCGATPSPCSASPHIHEEASSNRPRNELPSFYYNEVVMLSAAVVRFKHLTVRRRLPGTRTRSALHKISGSLRALCSPSCRPLPSRRSPHRAPCRTRPSISSHAAVALSCSVTSAPRCDPPPRVPPARPSATNIVDLLNVKVCADIWATGGYWHELQCSSRSTTNYYVINHRFERGCNSGRSYRTRAQWSYTDDDWGGGDLVWDYSNKNTC
jgi:hypothetical protein